MSARERLDLAIVTSCHNYGRYLDDWARSIARLDTHLPAQCAIVDNGSTDMTPRQVEAAAELLRDHGIETVTERVPYGNMGIARNRAVELGGETEWAMHLDADDMLMSHCLEDVAALMPEADVVSLGYRRCGDLLAGPRNRTRTYSRHRGESTLASGAPASGVSPFRRSFWERSPYRTDMRGGWDTALWIGFAHLDARFVPTRRPCFLYRQHEDSIFNRRRLNALRSALVGTKLSNLRKPIEGVSVVIPWEPDGGPRDRALEWVRRRYEALHPEWEVVVGRCPEAPWRKGVAIMDGIRRARGVVAVVADADVFVDPGTLREAVRRLRMGEAAWVIPHGKVYRLDEPSTARLLESDPADAPPGGDLIRKPYRGFAGGGMVVVDRSEYQATGGIPEAFEGWGAEDECLGVILDTLLGRHDRLDADLWHLWHPPGRRTRDPGYRQNRALFRVFDRAAGDPAEMWELVQHVAAGGDPTGFEADRRLGGVIMVALEKFQRGTEVLDEGQTFRATEEEARRHEARPRKIARRFSGSQTQALASRDRTLDIRARQELRNREARDERDRRRREMLDHVNAG